MYNCEYVQRVWCLYVCICKNCGFVNMLLRHIVRCNEKLVILKNRKNLKYWPTVINLVSTFSEPKDLPKNTIHFFISWKLNLGLDYLLERVSSSELVRSHQVLSLVRVEWHIQDGYQAEAASFIVVETEKTKQSNRLEIE